MVDKTTFVTLKIVGIILLSIGLNGFRSNQIGEELLFAWIYFISGFTILVYPVKNPFNKDKRFF